MEVMRYGHNIEKVKIHVYVCLTCHMMTRAWKSLKQVAGFLLLQKCYIISQIHALLYELLVR